MPESRQLMKTLFLAMALAGLAATACAAPVTQAQNDDGEVAAKVGDRTITMEQVDAAARKANLKAYQALYDARRQALDELVSDELFAAEAKSRGITKDELIDQEITKKTPTVASADIEGFYNENRARMRGKSLEEMSGQIRNYLASQGTQQARADFIAKLKQKVAVKISLDPPRADVKVAKNDPAKGPPDAPVLLVEYSDFQ